jgi:arylsulfatase A-like enzyme
VLENTVVIITSDHGEEFVEHGAWDHGNTLYQAGVLVPLLVLPPRLPAGRRVDAAVSNRDIPATVADLLDLEGSPFPGRSAARWWTLGQAADGDTVYTGVRKVPRQPFWYPVSRGDLVSIRVGPLRYIRNFGDGVEEVFDVVQDPFERRNLIADAPVAAALPAFRATTAATVAPLP